MDADDYIRLIRRLPRPTWEQTVRFAWFVAGAHSWYKHLPVEREVPFLFFLDPHAGKNLVMTRTGERAMVEITDQSTRFHYTWQTTETYRRRFGHWNYSASYGTSFYFAGDGGTVSTEGMGARVLDENGEWLSVPPSLCEAGTAHVNAFVHPHPWPRLLQQGDSLRKLSKSWNSLTRPPALDEQGPISERLREMVEDRLRQTIRQADHEAYFSWNGYTWLDEDWERVLRASGASDREVARAFAEFQWRLIERLKCHSAGRADLDLWLGTYLALEQDRQIAGMWKAMRRAHPWSTEIRPDRCRAAPPGRPPQPLRSTQMPTNKRAVRSEKGDNQETRPSLAGCFPTIARWASGYGWVEFGIDGIDRPFARALDEGGYVWEGEARYETLDEALEDLEQGLARFMEEQGFVTKSRTKKSSRRRTSKPNRKVKDSPTKPTQRRAVDPALKKVEKLTEIAAELRRGQDFSITRLTILKSLCEDQKAAGEFARFLARRVQKKLREGKSPDRYRKLVDRAVREMKPFLDDPTEQRKEPLWHLWHEMKEEQNEYRNIAWGSLRIIKSMELLVAEKCLEAILRADEAPHWLYQAARDYGERYDPRHGTGLIPASAPMVEEIAGFWRKYLRARRRDDQD